MKWMRAAFIRLLGAVCRRNRDIELAEELESHLEMHIEDNIRAGMRPEEARRLALLRLGGLDQVRDACSDQRSIPVVESLVQDLRFGLRALVKNPGFAAVSVLTLALGIGANSAIFSVVNAVLLKPLPFDEPDRLVFLRESVGKSGGNPVSYPNYLDWRATSRSFEEMAAVADGEFILSGRDSSERIFGEQITAEYLHLLGVAPVLGRPILPHENSRRMANAVALISYGLWDRRFSRDPAVLGRGVRLNDYEFTVVGVLPPGFRGLSEEADVWIPVVMHDAAWPASAKFNFVENRDVHYLKVLARLKKGVGLAEALAELQTIQAGLEKAYPRENKGRGALIFSAADVLTGGFRRPLAALLGAVGLVLMIACANVASLLLARSASRQREFAVRQALGAGRARLLQQVMVESLLLCAVGAATGLVFAVWGRGALVMLLPVTLPAFLPVRLDTMVFGFTAGLSFCTAIVLGLFSGWGACSGKLNGALKGGTWSSGGAYRHRIGSALVVAEVALTLILTIAAGLLLTSLNRMLADNPGFDPDNLVTLRFYVPERPYQADGRNRFGPGLAKHLENVAGVESAAVTFIDPFLWAGFQRGFSIEGRPGVTNAEADSVYYQECGPGYFNTMHIPLLAGREFSDRDTTEKPGVVIVSDSFAGRFWPGQNPVGKRIKYGGLDSQDAWRQVIGIAGDVKTRSIRQDSDNRATLYGPLLQSEVVVNMSVIVRTKSDPSGMLDILRNAIRRYAPDVAVYNIATVRDRLSGDAAETRSYALLLSVFAGLASLLSVVGVFGVLSQWVSQRRREIGIRIALGARATAILYLIFAEGMMLVIAGVVLGCGGALGLTRAMKSLLFGVGPADAGVFATAAFSVALAAFVVCLLSARRALRVDPILALRCE